MLLYAFFVFIVLVFGFVLNPKIRLLLIFTLLFIFSALRFQVGTDFMTYFNVTSGVIDITQNNYMLFEPLNVLLIRIGYALNSPQFYFVVASFLMMVFFYLGIKKHSRDYFLSALCFIGFPMFFLESLNIVRQFVAISIVFYSITYINERSFIKFLGCILLACLFHVTAFVAIIMYAVNLPFFGRKFNIFIFLLSIPAGKVIFAVLSSLSGFSKINYYLNLNSEGYFFVFMAMILLNTINFIFYEKLVREGGIIKNALDIFNLGCCFFLLFQDIPVIGGRAAFFFLIFLILIIPYYTYLFKQPLFVRFPVIVLLIALFFVRIWYSSYLHTTGRMRLDPYLPYKTVFQSPRYL
jgi:hypothetical protein